MTTTAATRQAAWLHTIADHLAAHPHLPTLNVHRGAAELQIYPDPGLPDGAHAVLLWASTLGDPEVWIRPIADDQLNVELFGMLSGQRVTVWSTDGGDLRRWAEPGRRYTPLSLDQLAAYVAAGTVEGVTA